MAFAEFRPLHAHKSVLVVDVRDADSFANGRIPVPFMSPCGTSKRNWPQSERPPRDVSWSPTARVRPRPAVCVRRRC